MKNFPFKAINPDTGKEQEFWYSRSMATAIFVFGEDSEGNVYVLANKRGPGCPDFIGYWVCPCGYLDYNERLVDAAVRECREETGVILNPDMVLFMNYNDDPKENRQNVTFRFTIYLDLPNDSLSNKENEEGETTDIKWIPVSEINNYDWAFGHKDLIVEALNYHKHD